MVIPVCELCQIRKAEAACEGCLYALCYPCMPLMENCRCEDVSQHAMTEYALDRKSQGAAP